jgi:hypothetical protein
VVVSDAARDQSLCRPRIECACGAETLTVMATMAPSSTSRICPTAAYARDTVGVQSMRVSGQAATPVAGRAAILTEVALVC